MKLTPEDKAMLLDMGHLESDFGQIEKATYKTTYEYRGGQIGQKRVLELLGRRSYLAGIGRSAFHFSAVQLTPQNEPIYFDSSLLFKTGKKS